MPHLGPEDLKVYVEAAVLGAENQGHYYNHITKRIPTMDGTNLPPFGLLDVLSFEAE